MGFFWVLQRGVNWEFSYFQCIFIFFRFFLVTLVLRLETSFDNFRRYILFDFAVEALSKRKRPHDPASAPRAPTSTLRPTAWGVDSRRCHFLLLRSRGLVLFLDIFIGEMSRCMQNRAVWVEGACGALESADSWELVKILWIGITVSIHLQLGVILIFAMGIRFLQWTGVCTALE
jgi:hypothetical protein